MPAGRAAREADIRRWRRYLADEQAEAAVYRDLAGRRSGEEREILLALAEAEGRHEAHWRNLLGDDVGAPRKGALRTRMLGFLARRFGSVFVLALAQRAESGSPYGTDADATDAMAADERIHEEVVRGLAARGRQRLSGSFRAAVFGINDGLVSNLALVLGVGAAGLPAATILFTGVAGLLAGALSMSAAMGSTGLAQWLSDIIHPMAEGHAWWMILLILMLGTHVIRLGMLSNVAAITMLAPILLALAPKLGLHPVAFTMLVSDTDTFAYLLPTQITAAVIAYSSGTFSMADYAKVGWVSVLIAIAYAILIMAPWYAFMGIPVWDPTAPWPFAN